MEKRHCFGKGIFALLVATATLAGCTKDDDSNDTPLLRHLKHKAPVRSGL